MPISIILTDGFIKDLKRIRKKYPAILSDIAELSKTLKKNPHTGVDLGQNIYKIRLAVSGSNKGKSGGARVITYVILLKEIVYLTDIYLKAESDTVDVNLIIERLKYDGLI